MLGVPVVCFVDAHAPKYMQAQVVCKPLPSSTLGAGFAGHVVHFQVPENAVHSSD
jgi:hypothetical protein